ncbi:MAG TPA: hydrogenase maturation protease [Vicinamibacterales bacterium]|nr:hydrogenase maturation protease [Vicinamibacterales bacterium]
MIILFGRTLPGWVVVAGVGRADRRDDGAGRELARRLASAPGIMALDCGDRLEDFTGDIAGLRPQMVLVADAVDLGAAPGSAALIEAAKLAPGPGDSHRATLAPAMAYLAQRAGATVLLLAIQPARVADGVGLSAAVETTVAALADVLGG